MKNKILPFHWTTTSWLVFSFLLSASLLGGALFFEHVLNYAPCQMCYWQRDAHKAVMIVAALGLVVKRLDKTPKRDRVLLVAAGAAFLVSLYLAAWHMGVEYKWWDGPKSCSAPRGQTTINPQDILDALNSGDKMPLCSDAPWDLFGISMAGYNALISAAAMVVSFALAFKGESHDKQT